MSDDADKPLRDYRETVFLPETAFPMRAGLPQAEAESSWRGWATSILRSAPPARRPARRCSCFTTGRPTPMAPSTSATR